MSTDLFDEKAGALRRRRAERTGRELFLHERAFQDVMDRLEFIQRRFGRALMIGWVDPSWRNRLLSRVPTIETIEPGELMQVEPASYDLCLSIGAFDTVNDLPSKLLAMRFALKPDSLAVGVISGGDTLPGLRAAMRVADEQMGLAAPHVHPRIAASALVALLSDAGFTMPVVDVDRVAVRYRTFADLVRDLRAMGATNILSARSRIPLRRSAVIAAAEEFESQALDERVTERFELLHFAAWTAHQ